MDLTPLHSAALLLVVSLVGALLPLYRRWSDRGLHLFVSVSAGVFLGTVFLHLLPHLAQVESGLESAGSHAGGAGVEPTLAPWVAALAGLLLLFALEKVWLRSVSGSVASDPHRALWAATWVGLGMHSLSEGIALAAILRDPAVRTQLLFSILIHKATEAFSLATVMRLARLGSVRSVVFLTLFALLGPLGILLGSELTSSGGALDQVVTGFACGTFLYVAVCDLLPEVFHGADRPMLKLASVGVGVLATATTLPRLAWAVDFASRVGRESLGILLEVAPYLLMGFLIAGVLNQVIKPQWWMRHMKGENLKSVALASLIGAPLPLCSCAVVPVAVSMRKGGASKGATTAFLIATPETGVDSITVSWALLDPILTVARFLGAILSAVFAGGVVSWFVRRGLDRSEPIARDRALASTGESGCHAEAHAIRAESRAGTSGHAPHAPPARAWLVRVLRYALVEMMDDLSASMVVGIVLSGLIAAVVPVELFQAPVARGFSGLVVMLLLGIPIYVCAAGSTPIAAALILKGMSPGAALVFLLASPATNLGSMIVLSRHLGKRVVLITVAALSVVTLALGWIVDRLYPLLGVQPSASIGHGGTDHPGWFAIAAAGVLGILLLSSIVRTRGAIHLFGDLQGEPQPTTP